MTLTLVYLDAMHNKGSSKPHCNQRMALTDVSPNSKRATQKSSNIDKEHKVLLPKQPRPIQSLLEQHIV